MPTPRPAADRLSPPQAAPARPAVHLAALLLRINRTALFAAIAIVFLAIVAGSFVMGLVNLRESARVQAQVLAENSTSAILFGDRDAAARLLGSLRRSPDVLAADLVLANQQSFARYTRGDVARSYSGAPALTDAGGLHAGFAHIVQEVSTGDARIGMLTIDVSIAALYRQTGWIALMTLLVAALALGVSSLLLGHLDRAVLQPLQALNELMARVHGKSDFSVRAQRSHIAEIDALGQGFNEMIEKIHDRDQRLALLAFSDVLTGLPNRPAFLDRLEREVQRAATGGQHLGLLFLDLDGFKQVNDTLGHECGDQLLVEAAGRIREALRPADASARADAPACAPQSARLGGDEFTVLVPDLRDADDALVVARRIGDSMRRPFYIRGRELAITASIGAAVYPEDGRDVPTLLQHADTAMYAAKRAGRDNSRRYRAGMATSVKDARPGEVAAPLAA